MLPSSLSFRLLAILVYRCIGMTTSQLLNEVVLSKPARSEVCFQPGSSEIIIFRWWWSKASKRCFSISLFPFLVNLH